MKIVLAIVACLAVTLITLRAQAPSPETPNAGPNPAKAKLLLDRGADVNIVAENGRTALWIAAASDGSAEAVRMLLAKGADPKRADKTKATPLWAAYGTGLAMYALLESGAATPTTMTIQRGTAYLLSTQRADGSWYVRSRAPKFQPYFDGGFPYEHDQWISAMATGWATAALSLSLGDPDAKTARATGIRTP